MPWAGQGPRLLAPKVHRVALDGALSVLAWRPGQRLQPGGRWTASEPTTSNPLSEHMNPATGVRTRTAFHFLSVLEQGWSWC